MPVEIPNIPLEDFEIPEIEDESIEDESGGSLVYGFIGSGQAGGRIVESFYNLGYCKVICVNTAKHDLNTLEISNFHKIHMDIGEQGAGKDMEKGENAAHKYQQEIYDKMKLIFGEVDRIIVCAGLGGGTGGGSTLVLLDLARKYITQFGSGNNPKTHVGAIVTLPDSGEALSKKVAENATLAATRLSEAATNGELSPLIFVDNDKIKKLYKNLTVKQFFPTVNATVAGLFHTFNVIATQDSEYITFDPADYSSLMSMGGCAIMGLTTIKEYNNETDISRALKANLEKTLLAGGFDLTTAKGAACIIMGGKTIFEETQGLMHSIEYGFDTIANLTGANIVHRGLYESQRDKLVAYTLLTGLDAPTKRIAEITKSQKNENDTKSSFYNKK